MKKWLLDILRGMLIGVANIIPGVSGGTMMVSMGIYDTLIYCITHLFKQFKKSVKMLLPYALGMVLALACLIRCILGPRISDRVLAINQIGTITVIMVALTVLLLGEGYLADIALVYAMLSFLAVILLSKVYTGIYQERKHEEALHKEKEADA